MFLSRIPLVLVPLFLFQRIAVVDAAGASEVAAPTRTGCHTLVGSHYDCDNGGWCNLDLYGTTWECFDAAGVLATSEDGQDHEESEDGTCIVHGGHTHGDCSSQCTGINTGGYDKGLHVGAIFIMLIASAVGVLAPIVFHKCMTKGRLGGAFFIAKHFGTGVILCTALVHLLYHSFIMFNNSCMADNIEYEATAPTLALAAVLLTFFIDYAMHTYIRRNSKAEEAQTIKEKSSKTQSDSSVSQGPVPSSRQEIVNVQLLEAGIIFHSIMIGVSLGATGGSQWIPLLCAIVFHQLFEGLGLGSRISELTFSPRRGWNKFLMGLAFSVITPIGVAIGVGVHESYDPNSVSALAAIGVLNALSAGILLYTGVVEMLVNDFIHGELKDASIVRAGAAIFFILLGALGMAVIGKWA